MNSVAYQMMMLAARLMFSVPCWRGCPSLSLPSWKMYSHHLTSVNVCEMSDTRTKVIIYLTLTYEHTTWTRNQNAVLGGCQQRKTETEDWK